MTKREKAIERFNKEIHRYIWHVSICHNTQADLCIFGSWGERIYNGYSLQEAIRKYNSVARRFAKLNAEG